MTRIAFDGYRRLVDTSCNVDSKLVAFLGPNEAGKSSILQALEWWSSGGKLEQKDIARNLEAEAHRRVVSATFILDDDDRVELGKRFVIAAPHAHYRVHRTSSGKRIHGFNPQVERDWGKLEESVGEMALRLKRLTPRESSSAFERAAYTKCLELFRAALMGKEPSSSAIAALELDDDERKTLSMQDTRLAAEVTQLHSLLSQSPSILAREALAHRLPTFVLYKVEDRSLQTRYDLDDLLPTAQAPEPLTNLLTLSEMDVQALVKAAKAGDTSRVRTLLKAANARLRRKLQPTWQQKQLSLRLESEGDELLVLVDELDDDGSRTTLDERSDGLRAFLGMTCFVLAQRRDADGSPVILLADEIDRHLHFDAQADLVSVLTTQTEIQQVLYTTHSPGCLPPDLGTSVRLVEPAQDEAERSIIRSSFWGTSAIGFSPLLVAMGAGAAAFSACRKAVLAEGATEMILLPTLLRLATGLAQLPYQVAPGLSSLRRDGLGLDEISAKVAYLIDGDDGGKGKAKLLSQLGVPGRVVVSLPEGKTLEDLIDAGTYLESVRTLLRDRQVSLQGFEVDDATNRPVVERVADACARIGTPPPGKTAVANYLIQDPAKIVLAPGAEATLRELHERFSDILGC
ncbi:AAA family ATPase [Micromonospora avicenniae]|uniref:AAA family ATPase n=1 Tax=Micromonospora avicenniae TaxID=1198245 RepID=UPI00332073F3